VLKPGTAEDVAAIVKIAAEHHVPIVPQGGNTGLVGGQVPDESNEQIVLSLTRLNAIRAVDPVGNSITVEAGAVLQTVQEEAERHDRLFPLSLGSQGSCTIGGNLATNAGGTAVLAYGNARDLTLGLEVVTGTGDIWNGLRTLRKDNTGYDLKDLFIGSEGTLGIITAASLKLFPLPRTQKTAFIGLSSPDAALTLFNNAQKLAGAKLTGFELMPRLGLEFVLKHGDAMRDPLSSAHDWYVLIEISSGGNEEETDQLIMAILEQAFEADTIEDAALAQSQEQSKQFWKIRHLMSEVQKQEGGSIKHDISVPISAVPAFLSKATEAVLKMVPGCRPVPFGHIGDGNIHFNVSQPVDADKNAYLALWSDMNALVHAIVQEFNGSISAEHGIGKLKQPLLSQFKSPVEMQLMKSIKQALDPKGIFNPGKVL
jgi:FAD/FMN-containing dehydrogenase